MFVAHIIRKDGSYVPVKNIEGPIVVHKEPHGETYFGWGNSQTTGLHVVSYRSVKELHLWETA